MRQYLIQSIYQCIIRMMVQSVCYKVIQMSIGRHQLLSWVNEQVQAAYPTIECLADGIAFAQILESLHPGNVNVARLNLSSRIPEDNLRNMRVVEESLRKLKVEQKCAMERMSQGKFQDIILFTQWLYSYAHKHPVLSQVSAYEKRVQILQKQRKDSREMNTHLKPNFTYQQEQEDMEEHNQEHSIHREEEVEIRAKQLQHFVTLLEDDLTKRMQLNWKLMLMLDQSIEERNILCSMLQSITRNVKEAPNSIVKSHISKILDDIPLDFK